MPLRALAPRLVVRRRGRKKHQGVPVNAFQATVSALSYSIIRERCPDSDSHLEFSHNQAVRFVLEQHGGMPDFLRFPFACVTVAFGLSSLLRYGKPFHRLPHQVRWRQVEAWRAAPLSVCRDLIRFYESFVVFFSYSRQSIRDRRLIATSANARSAA